MDPIEAFKAIPGEEMYIVSFQEYGVAEAMLEQDIARSLRCFYRKFDNRENQPPAGPEWDNFNIMKILNNNEATWPGRVLLDEAALTHYTGAFTQTGFRGSLNWYRNFSRNWRLSEGFEQKIDDPCLMICAADDKVLPPSMAEGMPKYIADLEKHIIADCGHWTQQEQPAVLARHMTDWLTRRFAD
jgi:pimeloyl-ACP methyl ester carboxylesterase